MSLSNLYFRGCFEPPSEEQKQAVEDVSNGGGVGDVVDKSCSRESVNTCGMSVGELFATYPIYDPQKGLYRSWGDIEFPWEISNLTPNLLISSTDDKWSVASYRALVAYHEGARVLLIENDGYRVSLYEADKDIVAISKAFDSSKWTKICHVETTEPAGVPTIAELRALYSPYELKLFDSEWGAYGEEWSSALTDQSVTHCTSTGALTISELEKCLKNRSSDDWVQARVRREFFYRAGDIVLVDGECGDALCVYIATQDIPATEQILASQATFDPRSQSWQRIYCASTGRNRCLEYQRKKEPELGYDVVEIGSQGHFVEMPVPYRLRPSTPPLNERVEIQTPPRVLTQAEIDALPQPQEE